MVDGKSGSYGRQILNCRESLVLSAGVNNYLIQTPGRTPNCDLVMYLDLSDRL